MARAVNWVYAGILLALAIDSILLHLFPAEFLPYAVLLMGVVILFTPINNKFKDPATGRVLKAPISAWANFSRRFIFGIILIFLGVASTGIIGDWGELVVVGTFGGSLVFLAIAAIYVLALFKKTRTMQIASY
jgi:hypothetical protein